MILSSIVHTIVFTNLLLSFFLHIPSCASYVTNKNEIHSMKFRKQPPPSENVMYSSPLYSARIPAQGDEERKNDMSFRPVFLTEPSAYIAADLALRTFQVLSGQITIPLNYEDDDESPGDALSLLPIHLVESPYKIQQILQESYSYSSDPIVCVPMDTTKANFAEMNVDMMCQNAATLGLVFYGVNSEHQQLDAASKVGSTIQHLAQSIGRINAATSPKMFISLDLSMHLALLKTNTLPKAQNQPHSDSYHVAMPEGGSTLIQYFYDFQNAFGGSDPLLCPTKETLVEAPPTGSSDIRNIHIGTAYTVLCGQGLNPLASAAMAASVATLLGDGDETKDNHTFHASWSTIERTVQLTHHIRQYGIQNQESGYMRKKYKEFGYQ